MSNCQTLRGVYADLPRAVPRGWLKIESAVERVVMKWWMGDARDQSCASLPVRALGTLRRLRMLLAGPQVRRGYPLSLSISISGGKETNKDSLSNGERTGNSPL
jgi:hypothetical protein